MNMGKIAEILSALAAGTVMAVGAMAVAISVATAAPAPVSYPRLAFAPPALTMIPAASQAEAAVSYQDREIRSLVRSWCDGQARIPSAVAADLPALCREWRVTATAAQLEEALHRVIWADDGPNVFDAARNQIVRFMGDGTMVEGNKYPWLCPHNEIVVNPPGVASFTVLHYPADPDGCGWQPVRNGPDGSEYWFGGALATPKVIYDYGSRVRVTGAACAWGCPAGNYITEFDARTLALTRMVPVSPPFRYLSLNTPVAAPGGYWMIGTENCGAFCKTGRVIWIPSGAEAKPAQWKLYGWLPSSLQPGTVVSLIRQDGQWLAVTKRLDGIGSGLEELSAGPDLRHADWKLTGKTWPTLGTISYSAQIDTDPAPAGLTGLTYAENDPRWYGIHVLRVRL